MDVELIKGSQLKILLKKKGIKQDDIVKEFGMNRIMISRYFNNKAAMPATFIIKVAAFANLSISDLIEGFKKPYVEIDKAPPIAAEPEVKYLPSPRSEEKPPQKDELVTIDVSRLTDIIDKLRTQLENVEQTVIDLKEGKFTVNN